PSRSYSTLSTPDASSVAVRVAVADPTNAPLSSCSPATSAVTVGAVVSSSSPATTVNVTVPTSDRKSTRLNSSHVKISYAVFCLQRPSASAPSTRSLHDALPISVEVVLDALHAGRVVRRGEGRGRGPDERAVVVLLARDLGGHGRRGRVLLVARDDGERHGPDLRSEEHTSELQSRENLVCRLLLAASVRLRAVHSFPTRRSSDLRRGRTRRSPRRTRRPSR